MATRIRGHKPIVLKLPFLVLYLSAFGLCIGLIERLLARTSSQASTSLEKRQACPNAAGWSVQLQPLETSYNSICRDFSATFAAHTTSLSPSLQTAFGQWLLQLDSITSSQKVIAASSLTCSLQSAGLDDCTSGAIVTAYATAGCTSSITRYNPCCAQHGTIYIQSSSVIISGYPTAPCAITHASQLAITSQSKSSAVPAPSQLAITSQTTSSAVPRSSQLAIASQSSSSKLPGEASAIPKASQLAVTSSMTPSSTSVPMFISTDTSSTPYSSTSTSTALSTPFVLGAHEVMVTETFTHWSYFFALYLAPIIAILLKAIHEMIVATVKLLEPFHLLKGAAHTSYPIIAQYLSSSISMDVMQSISQRRLLPLWTVSMYLIMPFLTPIASAAMSVRSRGMCTVEGIQMRCDPVWVINITTVRCLEVLLAVCCILVAMLIVSTWNYRSPLSANSASIASIAALLTDDSLLASLACLNPEASDKEFNEVLKQYAFWLQDRVGQFPQTGQSQLMCSNGAEYARTLSVRGGKPKDDVAKMRIVLMNISILFSSISLLALVLTYTFDYRTDVFNKFFNSQEVLPKLVMVGLATIVDVLFKDLERVVRITEPYRRLSLGSARPETTILLPLHGTSWSNLPRCLYTFCRFTDSRMFWQLFVDVATCLSDVNVVAVSGILFTDAQTPEAFEICSYVAIVITTLLTVVAAITVFWWRRQSVVRRMPRRPDTIGAVASYLCGSTLVRDWMKSVRFVSLTDSERYSVIAGSGRRFRFGKMACRDGCVRWCIDLDNDQESSEISSMYPRGGESSDKQKGSRIVVAGT